MYYITVKLNPYTRQVTIDDILNHSNEELFLLNQNIKDTRDTKTYCVDEVNPKIKSKVNYERIFQELQLFNQRYKYMIDMENKSGLYRHFSIPKKSGGLRPIDAPNSELMNALRELKAILENSFYALYHTSAFAYIHGRSTIDSDRRHQSNESRWYLKLDMKNFFPSINEDFLMSMLEQIFPFCVFINYDYGYKEELRKALSLCFLNNSLPQGTPTSPMLTNILMIPIDYTISKMCREHNPYLCYTRYADDLLISSKYTFKWTEVQSNIMHIMDEFHCPFHLNNEKTRYGSSSGRNWNLGLMINKDNNITVGHDNKKKYKTMIFRFMTDYLQKNYWDIIDVQKFLGITSYYMYIEPVYFSQILKRYSAKFNLDVMTAAKSLLQ